MYTIAKFPVKRFMKEPKNVHVYGWISSNNVDPSRWVELSFCLFSERQKNQISG